MKKIKIGIEVNEMVSANSLIPISIYHEDYSKFWYINIKPMYQDTAGKLSKSLKSIVKIIICTQILSHKIIDPIDQNLLIKCQSQFDSILANLSRPDINLININMGIQIMFNFNNCHELEASKIEYLNIEDLQKYLICYEWLVELIRSN